MGGALFFSTDPKCLWLFLCILASILKVMVQNPDIFLRLLKFQIFFCGA